MDLVKFINVNKNYGNKKILKDINLTIPRWRNYQRRIYPAIRKRT